MKQSKLLMITVAASIAMSVVGCGKKSNVLLTADKDQVAAFLVKAQNYAEEKTKLYDMVGSVYMTCVTNPEHYTNPFLHQKKNPCHQFFRVMSDYAKKSKAFHDVSISDLKNIAVVKRLENLITAYQVAGGNRQQAHDYLKSLSH